MGESVLYVRMSDELYKWLGDYATGKELTRSAVIRILLQELRDQQEAPTKRGTHDDPQDDRAGDS